MPSSNPTAYFERVNWSDSNNLLSFTYGEEEQNASRIRAYARAKKENAQKEATTNIYAEAEGVYSEPLSVTVKKPWATIKNKPSNNTLHKGDTHTLGYESDPENATVKWHSSNSSIAEFLENSAKIKANAGGVVTISVKVKYGDFAEITDSFTLTVDYPLATSIKITNLPTDNTLNVGDTHQLGCNISPNDALKNVKWDVVGDDIVDISANGKITARKAGNTKIKAYVENNPSVCDTIDLAICLTQKSYIFFNDANGYEKDHREAELNQKILAYKYYGGDTTKVELKLITSASSFKQQWNQMENNLGYVVVITHGTPEGLIRLNGNYYEEYFDKINLQLLNPNSTVSIPNASYEHRNAQLLNKDIQDREENEHKEIFKEKNMKGLVLLSCNAGHKDYINTTVGNVAMAFSGIVNGAPVIASDGTVHYSEKISDEFKDIEKFQNLTIYEKVYDSFVRYIDGKEYKDFVSYSRKGRDASGISNVAREINDGWIIYKKVNGNIIYTDVPSTKYEQGDYMPKVKTFTFSKLLELIHS